MTHEGTTQVKQSKIDMLTTEYELFRMKDDESIQDMHTQFTSIINELHFLGEINPRKKLVRKILTVLPSSRETKVNAITEAKDLQKLTIHELIRNLNTYEMKKKKDHERREPKKEKNLVLKIDNNDSSGKDADMAYLTKRFQKMVRRNGGIPKRGSSSKPRGYDLCHKFSKPGRFIKDYPLLKKELYKHYTNKAVKRNSVLDKRFKRKEAADNVVKQALAAWGDSSSESGDDDAQGDTYMMAVESEAAEYDSIFALMENLTMMKMMMMSIINDKNALTVELGDVENERDDLVVVKETIEVLKKQTDVLTKKIGNVENERDDMLGAEKGSSQKLYMDNGGSKHMTGSIDDFLSLKALQGGSVSFGNAKRDTFWE
ncbi:uncharacterized protein [Nicotiana tomentosiformis]|uniref:uncharacterized protein n=1 Tax=Nicotiana tomentosiformis TaxID=4098 RepID=UPI00388CBD9B